MTESQNRSAPSMSGSCASQYDVVTLGETMIRYSPTGLDRLEQSHAFEVHVGGSESNTIVGLSRLGLKTCWISRLTNNALGRRISNAIAAHGVDVSHVVWTEEDRIGTYYYEPGLAPRPSLVVYDRAGSAFSRFSASALPLQAIRSTRLLHATGISLALGEGCRGLLAAARNAAVEQHVQISFDFNYRSRLWSMADAKRHSESWVKESDIVFMSKRDACAWGGLAPDAEDEVVLRSLARGREELCTVLTLGEHGAIGMAAGKTEVATTTQVHGVGRLGGGDAFSAGFVYGWLQGWDLRTNLRWGNAAAALKYSIPGDLPWIHRDEIAGVLAATGDRGVIR